MNPPDVPPSPPSELRSTSPNATTVEGVVVTAAVGAVEVTAVVPGRAVEDVVARVATVPAVGGASVVVVVATGWGDVVSTIGAGTG